MERFEVVVLGAGAAGLMAGIAAAERGRSVLVLEKNSRPGVKILMSGGTRCNITNARGLRRPELAAVSGGVDPAYDPGEGRGARSIQDAFGLNGRFLGPALRAFGVADVVRMFEAEDVPTKVEANGKIFPVSNRAADVLAALVRRLGRSGAVLRTKAPARAVRDGSEGSGFVIESDPASIAAEKVVVATGGLSYPGSGTTGDGYEFAKGYGHAIVPPRPALVPLKVAADWVAELRGVSASDAIARVVGPEGVLAERREAILFAHFGLTGPAILDVSTAYARAERPESLAVRLDFAAASPATELDRTLQAEARRGRRPVAAMLPEAIPRRLAEALLTTAGLPPDRQGPDLSREERRRLVETIKGLTLPITGTMGFAKAEVTSGGVALDEVDPNTMESRLRTGLFLVGEALDLDGRIGGYNFQAAWSTGWLAGCST